MSEEQIVKFNEQEKWPTLLEDMTGLEKSMERLKVMIGFSRKPLMYPVAVEWVIIKQTNIVRNA
jgi:hypothetical protein